MADRISRRDFLKVAAAAAAGAALAGCAPKPVREALSNLGELSPVEPGYDSKVNLRLQAERDVNIPLPWSPDTRTSYIKEGDSVKLFFSAERYGYVASGRDLFSLGSPQKYLDPSLKQSEFGVNCYRAPGTVFKDKNGKFCSIEHVEEWQNESDGSNFTARIALSQSEDGINWKDKGIILDGQAPQKAGSRVSGAGQPSAILMKDNGVDYVYVYHTDWGVGPDSIHLARAPLGQVDNPDAWQKYNGSGFSEGKNSPSTPVISPPKNGVYSALASVSFNSRIQKYLATFEASNGFWLTTSQDGVNWKDQQQIAAFPEPAVSRTRGMNMFSYPSLLSFDSGDQFTTTDKGFLIYAKGVYATSPHYMQAREFNIK